MQTALAILAVVVGFISDFWSNLTAWLDKPATNGIVLLGFILLYGFVKYLDGRATGLRYLVLSESRRTAAPDLPDIADTIARFERSLKESPKN